MRTENTKVLRLKVYFPCAFLCIEAFSTTYVRKTTTYG